MSRHIVLRSKIKRLLTWSSIASIEVACHCQSVAPWNNTALIQFLFLPVEYCLLLLCVIFPPHSKILSIPPDVSSLFLSSNLLFLLFFALTWRLFFAPIFFFLSFLLLMFLIKSAGRVSFRVSRFKKKHHYLQKCT